jgi:hypothetical protein
MHGNLPLRTFILDKAQRSLGTSNLAGESQSERVNIAPTTNLRNQGGEYMQGTTSRRTREGALFASGAAAMFVVLLVLQSLLGSGLLSTKTVTVTVTTTTDPDEQVASEYASHLAQLTAGNISALASGYENNATVVWTGGGAAGSGLDGTYSGATNIGILLGSFVGKLLNFSLSNEYQSIGAKGNAWVNSTFSFQGYQAEEGKVNGTVLAQDTYEHVGNSWLIAYEMWNFTQFQGEFGIPIY